VKTFEEIEPTLRRLFSFVSPRIEDRAEKWQAAIAAEFRDYVDYDVAIHPHVFTWWDFVEFVQRARAQREFVRQLLLDQR
jgi:hypothetical protein